MAIVKSDDISNLASFDFQVTTLWEMYEELNPSLKFRIQSTSVLFPGIQTSTREPIGSKHISQYTPVEELNVTFLETTDFASYKYLSTWMDQIFDRQRMVFLSGNHRRNFLIGFQRDIATPVPFTTSSGARSYSKVFRLENMLIKKIEDVNLSYDEGGVLIFTASFAVDRVYDISLTGSASSELSGIVNPL